MYDKAEIRIPFHPRYVSETKDSQFQGGTPCGWVNPLDYDFRIAAKTVSLQFSGANTGKFVCDVEDLYTPWDSIPSSFSKMAVGFFPHGQGKYTWPHVVIKASPAKILQGHNVYGSENIREGIKEMMFLLSTSMPVLSAHLDFEKAELRILDCTYSARLENQNYLFKVLDFLSRQSTGKCLINNEYEGTVYLNTGSDYVCKKAYIKLLELLAEIKEAKRVGDVEKLLLLSDKKLLDFANNLLRLEATIKSKKLKNLGIPVLLKDFLKFHDEFEIKNGYPLCAHLWDIAFKKLLDDMAGHTMKRVDDESVKTTIYSKLTVIKDNGKICRRKANAVYDTYLKIRTLGYAALSKDRDMTFFRNAKFLEEIGFSRAWLRSLDPQRPADNVIPITQLIRIDFGAQRPDYWVEPKSRFSGLRSI